jgi:hypothetical protein
MQGLEERLGVSLNWVGATHSHHAPHLHAHLVAIVPHKLYVPDLEALRDKVTQACLEQRLMLDRFLTRQRERPYPYEAFMFATDAPFLDSVSDLPEPGQGNSAEALPALRQALRYPSRSFAPGSSRGAGEAGSVLSPLRHAGRWGRYEKKASYQYPSSGGSAPPAYRGQSTCTCPRCHQAHVHHTRDPVHRCDACGLILHRHKQLRLNHSRGR